jgi:hypothetical protein
LPATQLLRAHALLRDAQSASSSHSHTGTRRRGTRR